MTPEDWYLDQSYEDRYQMDDEPYESDMDSVEADADALASAGWGTDEDYGGWDDAEAIDPDAEF
jgi:hypothetical protein